MKTKKLLSFFLALCMLLSVIPMMSLTASATNTDDDSYVRISSDKPFTLETAVAKAKRLAGETVGQGDHLWKNLYYNTRDLSANNKDGLKMNWQVWHGEKITSHRYESRVFDFTIQNYTSIDVACSSTDLTLKISAPTSSAASPEGSKANLSTTTIGGVTVSQDDIKYYNSDFELMSGAPTENGTYIAKITIGRATASVVFTLSEPHFHNWEYTTNGATVTARCTTDDGTECDSSIPLSLTILPNENLIYDGNPKPVSLSENSIGGKTSDDLVIEYRISNKKINYVPTNAGVYKAVLKFSGSNTVVASLEFRIIKEYSITYNTPTGGTLTGNYAKQFGTNPVDLTVTPNDDYGIKEVSYTYNSTKVVVQPDDNGKYSFNIVVKFAFFKQCSHFSCLSM